MFSTDLLVASSTTALKDFFSDMSPIVMIVLGISLGMWIADFVIDIFQSREREKKQWWESDEEYKAFKDLSIKEKNRLKR